MIPAGIIVIWSGAIIDIPVGWTLCDGTAGTPDLRDRFVVGAGDTYAVDDTGGTTTHDHDFTTDGHSHGLPPGTGLSAGVTTDNVTNTVQDTGTTDLSNGLPPFFALAYIMKI